MKPTRKSLITATIVLTVSLTIVFLLNTGKQKHETAVFAMDTYMQITAYGRNGDKAIQKAVEEIKRLEGGLAASVINTDSGVALNDDGEYLLKRSMELKDMTDGTFDITIYPIVKAWGFPDKNYRVPSEEELQHLLANKDTALQYDFGGIAKGYTSDSVAKLMRESGVKSAILNLGGNVMTIGKKTDGSNWKVAIKNPDASMENLGVLSVCDKAVITSGGYERCFEAGGKTYHHIIDPQTGYPAESGLVSVTIISKDATLADALSTALFVMGKEKAVTFWRKFADDFDFVLYDNKGALYVSEGIVDSYSVTREYEVVKR